jgi:adenylate cyclase
VVPEPLVSADMGGLSRPEVADRAGVDPRFVDRVVGLGILPPEDDGRYEEGSVRRVRLIQMLERAGIALEGIASMMARGALPLELIERATHERFASYGGETFRDVSQRTGLPLELLTAIRESTGSAAPEPDERMREDELRVVPLIDYQLELGVRPAVAERVLRVFGESLRRMAEAESSFWYSDLVVPRIAAGQSWADIAVMAGETSAELSRRSDEAILAMYHALQTHAWMRNILEGVESALVDAGLQERPDRAPPAICFFDITGYTRLTEERGDDAALRLAETLARIVQRSSNRQAGRVVKWLGDGVMFHFPEPARGVVAALEMVEDAATTGLPPAHVGLHAGPVLFQDGDYFGRTVNIAARVADYARPGEVVVSQSVVELSEGADVRFDEIGPVELKGIAESVRLHVASRGS